MPDDGVDLRIESSGSGDLCRAVLATVPEWFGVAEANEAYAELADRTSTIVASIEGDDVGLLIPVRHSSHSAEVHLMAVRPERHRQGIGRAMLERAEADLRADGVEYLQVKTLSSRHPDEGYAKTRAFYAACGFRELEELDVWGPDNPTLVMIKSIRP